MSDESKIIVKPATGKPWGKIALIGAMAGVLLLFLVTTLYLWKRQRAGTGGTPADASIATRRDSPYAKAISQVEQDRGEPTGNKAKIDVPAELKLYKDRNRFLAIQVAESLEQKYEIPRDFAELAPMVERGDFERLPVLGNGYIIYGVGLKANDELTHFDEKTGKSIPLFSSDDERARELQRLDDTLKELDEKTVELKRDLAKAPRSDKAATKDLQKQITEAQKSSDALKKRRELIEDFYKTEENRRLASDAYEKLSHLAGNFNNRSYSLSEPDARKEFKVSLLSMLRTPARAMLEEIALAYQQKFGRPLPVTSLLRTREYQKTLSESGNPNAIAIDIPPHTTGLAFDIYTYYMTGEEQQFLIDDIARLEREGRVEALRENRDHIHVFAFADGKRPSEELILRASLISQRR